MKKDFLFRGVTFEFLNPIAYNPSVEKFLLAESHETGFTFQIICIRGYNAGSISGYIKEDIEAVKKNKKGISYNHFITELERNFGKIDLRTLKIEES